VSPSIPVVPHGRHLTGVVVWSSNVRLSCFNPGVYCQHKALLSEGDHIKITASKYPFPTVCADKQSTDWFHAISRTLKWNERERQKSFVVVEEGPAKEEQKRHQRKNHPEPTASAGKGDEEDEVSDEDNSDEEEEKFDIDDLSSEIVTLHPPPEARGTRVSDHLQEPRLHLLRRRVLQRRSWV
jgi:hypothetical protein